VTNKTELQAALAGVRAALSEIDDAIFNALDSNANYAQSSAAAVARLPSLVEDAKTKVAALGMIVRRLGVATAPVWLNREHVELMAWLAWVSDRVGFAGRKAVSDWEQWLDDAEGEIVGALEEREAVAKTEPPQAYITDLGEALKHSVKEAS